MFAYNINVAVIFLDTLNWSGRFKCVGIRICNNLISSRDDCVESRSWRHIEMSNSQTTCNLKGSHRVSVWLCKVILSIPTVEELGKISADVTLNKLLAPRMV